MPARYYLSDEFGVSWSILNLLLYNEKHTMRTEPVARYRLAKENTAATVSSDVIAHYFCFFFLPLSRYFG